MSIKQQVEAIPLESVVQIYSGKPGCACGCRGRYVEGMKSKRILANMIKFAEHAKSDEVMVGHDLDGNAWLSIESDDRVYTVYFKEV